MRKRKRFSLQGQRAKKGEVVVNRLRHHCCSFFPLIRVHTSVCSRRVKWGVQQDTMRQFVIQAHARTHLGSRERERKGRKGLREWTFKETDAAASSFMPPRSDLPTAIKTLYCRFYFLFFRADWSGKLHHPSDFFAFTSEAEKIGLFCRRLHSHV